MLRISIFILVTNFIFCENVFSQWSSQKLSSKRKDVCSCTLADKIFFIAGSDKGNNATKIIDILDLTSNIWTVKELKTPKSRPECRVFDGKIYVGGAAEVAANSKIIEVLDENGNTIQTLNTPNAIGGLLVENGGKLYVTSYGNMDVYDIINTTWTNYKIPISREVFLPRDNYGFVSLNNKIILAGGNYFGKEYKELSIFDTNTNTWALDSLSNVRTGLLGVTDNKRAYFVGGEDGSFNYYKTIEIYNESTKEWKIDSLSKGSRFDMSTIIYDDKLFVAGGQIFSFGDQFINLIDVLDLNTNKWSTLKLPTGRSSMTVIGALNKIYFAGGRSDEEDITDVVDIYQILPSSSIDQEKSNRFSIYPNPVHESLFLNFSDFNKKELIKYEIYNLNGICQYSGELFNDLNIETKNLLTGLYFIKVYDAKKNIIFVRPFTKF